MTGAPAADDATTAVQPTRLVRRSVAERIDPSAGRGAALDPDQRRLAVPRGEVPGERLAAIAGHHEREDAAVEPDPGWSLAERIEPQAGRGGGALDPDQHRLAGPRREVPAERRAAMAEHHERGDAAVEPDPRGGDPRRGVAVIPGDQEAVLAGDDARLNAVRGQLDRTQLVQLAVAQADP